ncbi:MAG: tetratricopeptide repeat protein [Helicobacteraceae bacterium]
MRLLRIAVALCSLISLCSAQDPRRLLAECDAGKAQSCLELGYLYRGAYYSLSSATTLKEANALYERACQLGDGRGCYELARLYEAGQDIRYDPSRAVKLHERSCGLGYGEACFRLGDLYAAKLYGAGVDGARSSDYPRAVELYKKACELEKSRARQQSRTGIFWQGLRPWG